MNPGVVGARGVFKDDKGNDIFLYAKDCGITIDKKAELHELKRELQTTKRESF